MRKRLTQVFPFLLPLRKKQKKIFTYTKMKFDKNTYSKTFKKDTLKNLVIKQRSWMINPDSGYDIKYQHNKVDNLKLASKTVDHVLIKPGEVFSFWYLVRNAEKYGKYKDGLVFVDGKIKPLPGGGLCQFSNLLHFIFLCTPLTIIERHSHGVKSLPNNSKEDLEGVDATVGEGWLDLKVKNETDNTFQIVIEFDDDYMYGSIYSDIPLGYTYELGNKDIKYYEKEGIIYLQVTVTRKKYDKNHKLLEEKELYKENLEVEYELPKNIKIEREG